MCKVFWIHFRIRQLCQLYTYIYFKSHNTYNRYVLHCNQLYVLWYFHQIILCILHSSFTHNYKLLQMLVEFLMKSIFSDRTIRMEIKMLLVEDARFGGTVKPKYSSRMGMNWSRHCKSEIVQEINQIIPCVRKKNKSILPADWMNLTIKTS